MDLGMILKGDDSPLYHALRFYLSHSTAIHTHNMWYLARVIDGNFTHRRELVLVHT